MEVHARHFEAYNNCPVCGDGYDIGCRCRLGDRKCANGHQWHVCPSHGYTVVGSSGHKALKGTVITPGKTCTCHTGTVIDREEIDEAALNRSAVRLASRKAKVYDSGFDIIQKWQREHGTSEQENKPSAETGGFDIMRKWQKEHGSKSQSTNEAETGGYDIVRKFYEKGKKKNAMPNVNHEELGKGLISDFHFEFLSSEDKGKVIEDLKNGERITLPDRSKVTLDEIKSLDTLGKKDTKQDVLVLLKKFLKYDPKTPKYRYNNHIYDKVT